jgi:hypothetical protein
LMIRSLTISPAESACRFSGSALFFFHRKGRWA